jgi:hypothetical protein
MPGFEIQLSMMSRLWLMFLSKKWTVYHLSGVIYTYCSQQKELEMESLLQSDPALIGFLPVRDLDEGGGGVPDNGLVLAVLP